MRTLRVAATTGLLAAAAVVAAVTLGGEDEPSTETATLDVPAKPAGTLTVLWKEDVDAIDHAVTYSAPGFQVAFATQRPLMSDKPGDKAPQVPDLASKAPEISTDGTTVTVRLKSGVRFSPPVNREVTARDVKYGIERGFFETVANGYAGVYFGDLVGAREAAPAGTTIPGIETPDDRTIVFKLSRPTGALVANALVLPLTAPVPREYALRYDRRKVSTYGFHQVATGPYMVELDAEGRTSGYDPGRSLRLVRNPNWERTTDYRPAYANEIEFRMGYDDAAVATRTIVSGSHLVSGDMTPPPAELKAALEQEGDQVELPFGALIRYVAMNTTLAPFDDVNVRRAVAAGFDREAMRRVRGGDAVADIATHFITPGTPGFREAGGAAGPGEDFLANPSGQPELAAAYMRKAGYASGRYEGTEPIFVVGVTGGADERASEVARESLERLGFDVTLRLVSESTMFDLCGRPAQEVHVCPNAAWAQDFPDPEAILAPTFDGDSILPANNSNISQLDDLAINAAMARASQAVERDERARAWGEIDRMITATAAAVPLTWDSYPLVRAPDVRGVVNEHLAQWDLSHTSLR
jgi:peptide/nickel transport system substrate-binding protein